MKWSRSGIERACQGSYLAPFFFLVPHAVCNDHDCLTEHLAKLKPQNPEMENVVRQILRLSNCERFGRVQDFVCGVQKKRKKSVGGETREPDEPFHNFRDSRSGGLNLRTSKLKNCEKARREKEEE